MKKRNYRPGEEQKGSREGWEKKELGKVKDRMGVEKVGKKGFREGLGQKGSREGWEKRN